MASDGENTTDLANEQNSGFVTISGDVQAQTTTTTDATQLVTQENNENTVVEQADSPTPNANDITDQGSSAPSADGAWEPTAEEVTAAAEFDEANADDEPAVTQFTQEQLLQQMLDHEMALQFDTMENGAGHDIHVPWDDRDAPPETFECVCGDIFTWDDMNQGVAVMITCSNNHVRCKPCLNENVKHGITSRLNYPPKCCGPFDIADVIEYLAEDVRAEWIEKQEEFDDVSAVYCAVKECSQYIAKGKYIEDGKWAPCDKCNVNTCTGCLCAESAHDKGSDECPERLDKMNKDLMVKEGWKPCPRCAIMIERIDGCDHMECQCGQQFCYSCGRLLDGAIACNCNGQRAWVEDDEDMDVQAQQQMLEDIANGAGDPHWNNDDEGGWAEDAEEDEEDGADMQHDGEADEGDERDEEDDESEDDEGQATDDNGNEAHTDNPAIGFQPVDAQDVPQVKLEQDIADLDANVEEFVENDFNPNRQNGAIRAIRALARTEPQLAIRMDLLTRAQAKPFSPTGFTADVERVRGMTGDEFRRELSALETALSEALLNVPFNESEEDHQMDEAQEPPW